MKVRLHSITIWPELHGREVEVLDARWTGLHTVIDVPIVGSELQPPLPKDVLNDLSIVASEEWIPRKAIGVIAIGVVKEAWDEFIGPRIKAAVDAEYARYERIG